MIITKLLISLMPFLVCAHCYNGPNFINGRPRGGFTGDPYVERPELLKTAEDKWFTQKLDHFSDADTRTWQQRYFVNTSSSSWRGGPVFLMIGGEGTLSPKWLSVGAMVEYAQEHGALMFGLEHRFYGKSRPLPNTGVSSLQFLSSEQALADLATFRVAMTKKYQLEESTKWIAFGGSYPGALSAWFRFKYPHLVHGAVASSAPIKAVLDFPEYLEVSTRSLGSVECKNNVRDATDTVEMAMRTERGRQELSKKFQTCTPLTHDANDQMQFTSSLAGNFFGIIQYNRDNRVGSASNNITVDDLCAVMNNKEVGTSVVDRYAAINHMIMKMQGSKCLDISYNKFIQFMRNTDWKSPNAEGARQWTYQTCTEFGYFQSTDSIQQVFGTTWPVSFFIQQCVDIYGSEFNKTYNQRGIDWTNANYGGYGLAKGATRIIFPNGSIDPWHALSFVKSEESIIAIYIHGTAHCSNMYPPSSSDPAELMAARYNIGKIIGRWLDD